MGAGHRSRSPGNVRSRLSLPKAPHIGSVPDVGRAATENPVPTLRLADANRGQATSDER
jgi:hypothetical protein